MRCPWAGVYPTVVVPFCDQGGVDTAALEKQLRYQLDGGVHGLLVLGTLGEGMYVSPGERAQVIVTTARVAGRAVPIVVGIHTCNVESALAQMLQARDLGASAVLVKYLGNPHASAGEVLGFYASLSDAGILPIFYYHYPDQTGLELCPQDVAAVVSLPGVVGIKESTLDLPEIQEHIALTRSLGKVVLSSTVLNLTQVLESGGQGAMCPEAVVMPGPAARTYQAWIEGRPDEARALQKELFATAPIVLGNLTPVALERRRGHGGGGPQSAAAAGRRPATSPPQGGLTDLGVPTPVAVKYPLPPLSARDARRVARAVRRLQAIDWTQVAR